MQIKDFNLKINQQLLLDNVSMSFANQKLNLIIGRNGVGKTLLLDLISDLDHNRPENFHDFLRIVELFIIVKAYPLLQRPL